MSAPRTPLRASALRARVAAPRFRRDLRVLGVVDSTLDVVADLARRGAPDGTVVVAESQRRGRGRRGGAWASEPDAGVYVTALVRPGPTAAEAPLLSGAAGLAAAEAIRRTTGLDAAVKWPNDVWVGGRKVGGVLIESTGGPDGHAAIGIGLTLTAPKDAAPGVAPLGGLAELAPAPPSREALVVALLDALADRLDAVARDPAGLRAEFRARDALRGAEVTLDLPDGAVAGRVVDADLVDGLELERPDGTRFRVRAALAHVAAVVRREA